jgi:hypothetical protein
VSSIIRESVILHNLITNQRRLFCEDTENYAVNQSSHRILNDDDDDGRQRLSRAQRLRNQLADYSLTPAGAIPSQWSYTSWIQLIIAEDRGLLIFIT